MSKTKIITGLDIGTSTIKMLVAAKKKGEEKFDILFLGEEPSLGVRRGVVTDTEKVSRIIQILVDKARTESGQKIHSVFVNIGGCHLISTSSRGMVAVSRADRSVSKEDVDRVLQEAARAVSLPSNNEILETYPREFIVDGMGGIKVAEGLQGGRLETEVLILSGFMPYKNNLVEAVVEANIQIADIIPSPLASSAIVLSQRQKELGVALLEIGAGTSELAVFEEGDLTHLAIFPIGSANITSDIAIGLKTDIDTAEIIKIERGCCLFKGNDKKEKIEIEGEEPLSFSQKTLAGIVEARVSEIFDQCQKELKRIGKIGLLPSGVVLTGGGAKIPKIVDLAKKELKLPCRLGKISHFPKLEDEPNYATVCGLVFKGSESEGGRNWQGGGFSGSGLADKIKKIFKIFIP
ncbi:MAG: cell division protein FtsA [Candidatus Pacebacteria bacterium]|nr:cell division protein FtsA [Candidatus Paceibacterota bacterium]